MSNATVRYCAHFSFSRRPIRSNIGQATLEYFIIFALLTAIAVAGFTGRGNFLSKVRSSAEGFFQSAAGGMK